MVGWRRLLCYLDDGYHWLTGREPDGQHRICQWHDEHLLVAFNRGLLALDWVEGMTEKGSSATGQEADDE